MCLITFLPAGVQPDPTRLHTGAQYNSDGHGFAIVTGDDLIVEKGLDGETLVAAFTRARRNHPDGPALFHSRLRTHGPIDVDNCHPFAVGGDRRTMIAHNGILPRAVHPRRGDPRSDTRILAEDHLPRLGSAHLRRTRLRLERWMGPNNLMVLLTVDRRYRQQAHLFNESRGIWDEGVWYSNDSYLPPLHSSRRYHAFTDLGGDEPIGWAPAWSSPLRCASCGALTDAEEAWCAWCDRCWACGELPTRCTCWAPAVLRHQ